jgi:hypothetical protein
MGAEEIRRLKLEAGIPKPKKFYQMPKVSKKRQKRMAEDNRPEEERLDEWFLARRKEMTGTCQCGCGGKSCKKDDLYYRHSICHIFPKNPKAFPSVATHPLNWVELAFWGGCHGNMDNRSVEKWPQMACWDDIKAKVLAMEPYLTPEEKGRKFYQILIQLVNSKD